jgi:hypothetical protein
MSVAFGRSPIPESERLSQGRRSAFAKRYASIRASAIFPNRRLKLNVG